MFRFFRRFEKQIFGVVAVLVISSFLFFGTFEVLFRSGQGSGGREELIQALDQGYGDAWLSRGVGEVLLEKAVIDWEKVESWKPYVHPQAPFISALAIWERVSPDWSSEWTKARHHREKGAMLQLYCLQRNFPPDLLRRFLAYQQTEAGWVRPDPRLYQGDLSLFSFRRLSDWFGLEFVNAFATLVEEKGGLKGFEKWIAQFDVKIDPLLQDAFSKEEIEVELYRLPDIYKKQEALYTDYEKKRPTLPTLSLELADVAEEELGLSLSCVDLIDWQTGPGWQRLSSEFSLSRSDFESLDRQKSIEVDDWSRLTMVQEGGALVEEALTNAPVRSLEIVGQEFGSLSLVSDLIELGEPFRAKIGNRFIRVEKIRPSDPKPLLFADAKPLLQEDPEPKSFKDRALETIEGAKTDLWEVKRVRLTEALSPFFEQAFSLAEGAFSSIEEQEEGGVQFFRVVSRKKEPHLFAKAALDKEAIRACLMK
jgi:hypothetical protein